MASWSEFAADEPRLADGIRLLMQQYGPGFGYLATVRADGGPRVHPVSPVITDDGLYCFVIDSPKRRDLERDGRYALHSFPPEESDDEAYVAGRARPVTDDATVARLAFAARAAPHADWRLFEFTVDVAMLARREQSVAGPSELARARCRPTPGGTTAAPPDPHAQVPAPFDGAGTCGTRCGERAMPRGRSSRR
ncbi:pyridoxamine 5'-phosphate oxidase family protein [Verrucosispora sioxanthis]|uniref:pyridoxamine 5'-phosphate oxidase family protein n=1 Tax=Verrucosispora sioxanthis TaxID=2499994 RepID=UPI00209CF9F4|nr:pyridoxamine 5'-phosphate oxidase family protein [Verrucosispora sioxanthis]